MAVDDASIKSQVCSIILNHAIQVDKINVPLSQSCCSKRKNLKFFFLSAWTRRFDPTIRRMQLIKDMHGVGVCEFKSPVKPNNNYNYNGQ